VEIHEKIKTAIAENTKVDNRLNALRRDFETEASKIKHHLMKLERAFTILANEATRAPANSTLSPEVYNLIMSELNA